MNQQAKITHNQKGMVALMVAMFLVLIISLVVVNYSRLVRREQRQILDRQLATQALYVAESGVEHIKKQLESVSSGYSKTDCGDDATTVTNLEIEPGLEVTCSFVETELEELRYDSVGESAEVVPIFAGTSTIHSVTIKWSNKESVDLSGCTPPLFPATFGTDCSLGVLKVDMVDTSGNIIFPDVLDGMFTAYFYPKNSGGGGTINWSDANTPDKQGRIAQADCNADGCSMTINGLGGTRYHMRIKSLYKSSDLHISATGGPAPHTQLNLIGAQASIDVTAKASDVIRRIKTYVSISGYTSSGSSTGAAASSSALQTAGDVCKEFKVIPDSPDDPDAPGSISSGC